ncbi:MAG: YkgJ family cysteine cluster protein [Candidatus Lindowbacteria bacterium]|nr:YkgJ family cysteine cluster protein [Candidatus Lindowbacteria bacterium]
MTKQRQPDDRVTFLGRSSSFRFECKACGRCCGEYRIVLSPYDVLRLSRATGLSSAELRARGTIQIKRESFKNIFGFAPITGLFEVFGFPRNDTVPIATLAFRGKQRGKNVCEFLAAPRNGKRLCAIYADRPTMCRLHPLGCVTIANRRRWFFRQPLCETSAGAKHTGTEHTVSEWMRESGARPFLAANARFLSVLQRLLSDRENLLSISEDQWKLLEEDWYYVEPAWQRKRRNR